MWDCKRLEKTCCTCNVSNRDFSPMPDDIQIFLGIYEILKACSIRCFICSECNEKGNTAVQKYKSFDDVPFDFFPELEPDNFLTACHKKTPCTYCKERESWKIAVETKSDKIYLIEISWESEEGKD
jgi:hypothetical protein